MPDYRKLTVWLRAKDLAVEVYRAVESSGIRSDFGLRDQILRAAVSVPSNIAEGYARETPADRTHFLTVARGSCAELETQLTIAAEVGLLDTPTSARLGAASEEISKMLFALRATIRATNSNERRTTSLEAGALNSQLPASSSARQAKSFQRPAPSP